MIGLDQRVCNCRCHASGIEDCYDCCAYVAQCERDEARAEVERLRARGGLSYTLYCGCPQ